jgi:hypothetical protein
MNGVQQTMASNIGSAGSLSGFLGFWAAVEPYTKAALAILTVVAVITTILVNVKNLRKR